MSSNNLSLQITSGALILRATTDHELIQEELQKEIRALSGDFLAKMEFPPMARDKADAAEYEVVSAATLRYIGALEKLLEKVKDDPCTSDELVDEIEQTLR